MIHDIGFAAAPGVTPVTTNNLIRWDGGSGNRMYNHRFDHVGCNEISLGKTELYDIEGGYSDGAGRDVPTADSYCITAGSGAFNGKVSRFDGRRARHMFTSLSATTDLEPALVGIGWCSSTEVMEAAIDTHPGMRGVNIHDCNFHGAYVDGAVAGTAIQVRGRDFQIDNCNISGFGTGISIAFAINGRVTNNVLRGCINSFRHFNSEDVTYTGNRSLYPIESHFIYNSDRNAGGEAFRGMVFNYNELIGQGSGPAIAGFQSSSTDPVWGPDWVIAPNRFVDITNRYGPGIPTEYSHGYAAKTTAFSIPANLSATYELSGTFAATLPPIATDDGSATYTFRSKTGSPTVAGDAQIDGAASPYTPASGAFVAFRKNGATTPGWARVA